MHLVVFVTVVVLGASAAQANLPAAVREVAARDAERQRAANAEDAARLTLAWLRALQAAVDAAGTSRELPPAMQRYADMVFYNEIGGSFLLSHDRVLALHDQYRGTKAADDLAWFAAGLALGGECEGYVPCYMSGANAQHGEYLRRHPNGAHAGEAMRAIMDAIRSAQDLIRRYPDLFTPKTDCADLLAVMPKLEDAVQGAEAPEQAATSELIHELAARCEPGQ